MRTLNLTRWGSLALLVCGATTAVAAQDIEAQEERALGRVTELFVLRLELQVEELERDLGLEPYTLDAARIGSREAVSTWFEEHEIVLQHQGSISWTATPIEHEPFAEFVESEFYASWADAALEPQQRERLSALRAESLARVQESLAELISVRVGRALCLTDLEREQALAVFEAGAQKQWEAGVTGGAENYYWNATPKDQLRELLDEERLLAALPAARRRLVAEMFKDGRSTEHNLQLEAEHLLQSVRAGVCALKAAESPGGGSVTDEPGPLARERRLLYGLARALVHRNGGTPKTSPQVLLPPRSKGVDKLWATACEGLLAEGAELPAPSARDEEGEQAARAAFLFAALDERACFSEEQREGLIPLLEELVSAENFGSRDTASCLKVPGAFAVSKDGLLIPGEPRNGGSTKLTAQIKTFYESCTQTQRDVLKS